MSEHAEWVVVFRSMDPSAREDAQEAHEILRDAGFQAELIDDSVEDAPPGSFAVRVAPQHEAAALAALRVAETSDEPVELGDPSAEMDLKVIFEGQSTTSEIEALAIESVLKANGIPCLLQSGSEIPTLPFAVLVPARDVERAMAVLAEAKASGPEAAEAAQSESV